MPSTLNEFLDNALKNEMTYDDATPNPQAYTSATKRILDAWISYQRIYMDEQMNIFANKDGVTASKKFMKMRDKIAVAHTRYENLLSEHHQMAKKVK